MSNSVSVRNGKMSNRMSVNRKMSELAGPDGSIDYDTVMKVVGDEIDSEKKGKMYLRLALLMLFTLMCLTAANAGLTFPVSRVGRMLKKGGFAKRVGAGAPVYLAAVLEYLVAESLELAGNCARDHKKMRIIPRHIALAVRNDEELSKYLADVTIASGGVPPNIHNVLLTKKSGSKKAAAGSQEY